MFDTIGKNPDPEARRRAALSLTATLGSVAGAVGFVAAVTLFTAVQVVLQPDEVPLVEFVPDEAPALVAPPPPLGPAQPTPVPATPDDPVEPQPLREVVDPVVRPTEMPSGQADGEPGGQPGGVPGGDPLGEPGGSATGIRVFHHSELRARTQVPPEYPEAAKALGLGEQRCRVTVRIDEQGVPYEAAVAGCPTVFHDSAREGLLRWRWYPARIEREAVRAQTTVIVVYRLN